MSSLGAVYSWNSVKIGQFQMNRVTLGVIVASVPGMLFLS